jgi:VanZ family protein
VFKITNRLSVWPVLCTGLTIAVLWLSLMPADSVPSAGLGWDKLNHTAAIAAITLLAFLSFKSHSWAARAAFLYGISLGILIELFQAVFTTTRSAEWGDLLADLIGAGFVLCLISFTHRKREPL